MNSRSICTVILISAMPALGAEKPHNMESAKVISQEIGANRIGAYRGPLNGGTIAYPIYRRHNHIVIESGEYRYGMDEVGRSAVVLPINGVIQFYRDGKFFIIQDDQGKKHKFAVTGMLKKDE